MNKSLDLTYIGHATVLIEMNGVRVLTDPLLRNRVAHIRRQGSEPHPSHVERIDAVLISHLHLDHLDLPSLRRLGRDVRLIVPRGTQRYLRNRGFNYVEEVGVGEGTFIDSLEIEATYAKHSSSRFPFGPSADSLGFLIRGKSTVYFAGDTDIFPQMATLADRLDVALLPVGGWGPRLPKGSHLDPLRAAESLTLLKPRVAVPIHWGAFQAMGMGWMRPGMLTKPAALFAHHARRLAPDVGVHVVPPGELIHVAP